MLQEAAMRPVALSLFSAACFAAHTVRTDAYADVAPLGQACVECRESVGFLCMLFLHIRGRCQTDANPY